MLSVTLARPLSGKGKEKRIPRKLWPLLDEIRAGAASVRIRSNRIEATLAGAVHEPSAIEPLLENMVRLELHSLLAPAAGIAV